ncbi:MAG: hypothetical protein Q8P01_04530 [bacterium]|nr:hypothetical protein [bacterium]
MMGYISPFLLSILAFFHLLLAKEKSDFTPLWSADQMLVNCRGVASGGSAFSFRPAVNFCSSVGGIDYD